ncbi:unnamed protein product, partial [Polarella glacialis]
VNLNGFCARLLCDWFAKIGNPDPVNPVVGVPASCLALDLPWRTLQCVELTNREPYNPSPWMKPLDEINTLECSDRTKWPIDVRNADTGDVCNQHGYRWKCPKNFPIMCSEQRCVGDHCCKATVEECFEGQKQASVLLTMELDEWLGMATPAMIAARVTTTSVDAYQVFLS